MKRLQDEPFALIGVNSDKDLEKLAGRLEEENISWRSFWNGPEGTGGPISSKWNVQGWPTIYVLDHEGVIRFKSYKTLPDGEREYVDIRGEKLDQAVDLLLQELAEATE